MAADHADHGLLRRARGEAVREGRHPGRIRQVPVAEPDHRIARVGPRRLRRAGRRSRHHRHCRDRVPRHLQGVRPAGRRHQGQPDQRRADRRQRFLDRELRGPQGQDARPSARHPVAHDLAAHGAQRRARPRQGRNPQGAGRRPAGAGRRRQDGRCHLVARAGRLDRARLQGSQARHDQSGRGGDRRSVLFGRVGADDEVHEGAARRRPQGRRGARRGDEDGEQRFREVPGDHSKIHAHPRGPGRPRGAALPQGLG